MVIGFGGGGIVVVGIGLGVFSHVTHPNHSNLFLLSEHLQSNNVQLLQFVCAK